VLLLIALSTRLTPPAENPPLLEGNIKKGQSSELTRVVE